MPTLHYRHALPILCIVVPALVSCSSPSGEPLSGPEPLTYDPAPEPPAILRDVAMVDDNDDWTHPFLPGIRTTQDGRVGLRVQGGPNTLSFYLFAPETVEEPILTGPNGAQLLANTDPVQVVLPIADNPDLLRVGHHAICDPTEEFAVAGERTNPYACGTDLANDCYDFTVISSTSESFAAVQMWGTPVTVEVSAPKTINAEIVRVELGQSIAGASMPLSPEYAEVQVTLDGRVLSGRLGGAARTWINPETGEEFLRPYDLMYAVLPQSAEPCDVTQWTDFHPISHAPYDPNMRGYGVGAYPIRDTEGNLIADGEDMGGSYPWMDREGANVFMTGVPGTINEQSHEDYPRTCVVEGCEQYEYDMDFDRGFLIAGLWTHGKLVYLDALINNVDWSVGMRPDTHYMVDLYRDSEGNAVPVRFGSGRGYGGPSPGYPANPNILDSLQSMFNWKPALRPVTPRDVVWIMSSGVATDEVAFDDFLDPRAFIVSNMQASVTQVYDHRGFSTGVPQHNNGQVRRLGLNLGVSNQRAYPIQYDQRTDVHIQNAATTLEFPVPAFGRVEVGTGRSEPVALGGFYGRGFWLSGENRIQYEVPELAEPIEGDWYVGVFVDPRTSEGATRSLISFPDGTSVRLVDREKLQYVFKKRVQHEVTLPASEAGWIHLGFSVRRAHRELTLLVNGFPFDRFEAERPFFGIEAGEVILGRGPDLRRNEPDAGVRGWVDDFKVLAHDVDPEVACNHAGGTLVAITGDVVQGLLDSANRYPEWAHDEIAAAVGRPAGGRYACFHDYSDDYAASLANIPGGTESLRQTILFPEGPLRAGAPRPDSSDNAFCLSCHTEAGQLSMGLEALEYRPDVMLEHDRRRQPHQPPRRVFGNIPAGWIPAGEGPGSPAEAMVAPAEGLLIDPWILPR